MLKRIKNLLHKYREIISYTFFGCGATLINIVSFYLFHQILHIDLIAGNVLAWILAFLFAFFTNKIWVFESREWRGKKVVTEMRDFLIARLATLVLDTFFMWLLVEAIRVNSLFAKIVVNIIVIVANYAASKLWVFRAD